MHLLVATQVFPPETHPSAVMISDLARFMVEAGWEVTVVAGYPHHPYGRVYPGYRKKLFAQEQDQGVRVIRSWHLTSPSRRIGIRGAVYLSQVLGNGVAGLLARRPDVVLVLGPPILGALVGGVVARRHRAALVNIIYDLYPDILVESGKLRSPALLKLARAVEQLQYRLSQATVVLSEGFRQTLISRGVDERRVTVIPVWLDASEVRPMSRDNAWRREMSIPVEKLVVLYAGTIGLVSGAMVVAEAARLLRDQRDILFVFNGEGGVRESLEARARELQLENMRFLPFQPRERLAEVQATGDIGLVTLAPGRGRTSVPSKVLGYMAAARPVLASVDEGSDTARQIRENGAGLVVPPGDAQALAEAVLRLKSEPALREQLGLAGRRCLEEQFSREAVLAQYRMLLESVAARRPPHSARANQGTAAGRRASTPP